MSNTTEITVNPEEISQYCSDGAKYLDNIMPDWFEKIDTYTLDMLKTDHCILGQLYGTYYDGLDELNLNDGLHDEQDEHIKLGFDAKSGLSVNDIKLYFRIATGCWIKEIITRKGYF